MNIPTKAMLVDNSGKPLTQSLFLELGYNEAAVYTLKEDDYEYNGKKYISIKKCYLVEEDPSEYEFATKYFLGFRHWQRICANKVIRKHIDEWREELEYKLRSKGVKAILESAKAGNYQAAKFFVDKGWDRRNAGRPSKAEVEREMEFEKRVASDFNADVVRLFAQQ